MSYQFLEFTQRIQTLLDQGKPFVTVTLTNIMGSAPQNLGARMIVSKDKIEFGTIGGGKIEHTAIEYARNMLNADNQNENSQTKSKASSNVKSVTWNLQKDIGMTCGGKVSLLFEKFTHTSDWNIVIFGAGHVSQELTRQLLRQDCTITVIDSRKKWLNKLPVNDKLTIQHIGNASNDLSECVQALPKNAFVILMTMGSDTDFPILHEILDTNKHQQLSYLGMIGSLAKRQNMEKKLKNHGIDPAKFDAFICPIGENIGGNTPAEISISIIAQMLGVRS